MMDRDCRQDRQEQRSPTVTPYINAVNNAAGSRADEQRNNAGRNNTQTRNS